METPDLNNPGPRGFEKVIPITPEVDVQATAESAPVPDEQPIVMIDDVDTMGGLIISWYERKKHDLNHLLAIPEGTEVQLFSDKPGDTEESIILTGAVHQAFRLGVQSALVVLGDLPFGRMPRDESDQSDQATTEAVNTEVANDHQPG